MGRINQSSGEFQHLPVPPKIITNASTSESPVSPSSDQYSPLSVSPRPIRRKLVVIGDGAAGKTSLLVSYKEGTFNTSYVPTVFENSLATVPVESRTVELSLWDTAGQEDYDRLRPLSYPESNVILICFALDKPESLMNAKRKWAHELDQFVPSVPRILVGCKSDLRSDPLNRELVTNEQGKSMAEVIGAVSYIECSAKLHENIDNVFFQAARVSLTYQRRRTSKSSTTVTPVTSRKSRCIIQ